MSKDSYKKIALVTISLAGGGAERSTALLSQILGTQGFNVHIITLTDAIDYEYAGTLFNLGKLKTSNDSIVKRLHRFSKLKAYFDKESFNFIIDSRNRRNSFKELYYLSYLYKKERVIYMVRSFKLQSYFPKNAWVAHRMIKKSTGVVGVSKEISKAINSSFKIDKAVCIYNPVSPLEITEKKAGGYYIFVGRLVDSVKNVSLLIDAFAKAYSENPNHKLKICGDGADQDKFITKVAALGLQEAILFEPFDPRIFSKMSNARALILTSHYEGFPRVIIEALSMGTPVISVNCKSGPSEVIRHEENGLLVKNHDTDALAAAITRFTTDEALYQICKENARESVAHLSMDTISNEWATYLNNL